MGYKDYNDYELLAALDEEDEVAKKILMYKYEPLIVMVAKEYRDYLTHRKVEEFMFEDFILLGQDTLLSSARSYNEKAGVLFYTYFLYCLKSKFSTFSRSLLAKKNQPAIHYQALDYEVEDFCVIATDIDDNPEKAFDYSKLENTMKDYLYKLSFEQQNIIQLRLNGFCYREIETLLEVSKDCVSRTIRKAKRELVEIIN